MIVPASKQHPVKKTLMTKESVGCIEAFLKAALLAAVGCALYAVGQGGASMLTYLDVTLGVGMFGSFWKLTEYAGQGSSPPFSHKWCIGWGAFVLWLGGIALGAWLVVPSGPGEFEVLRVVWWSIKVMSWPVGGLGLILEFAAKSGKWQFQVPNASNRSAAAS